MNYYYLAAVTFFIISSLISLWNEYKMRKFIIKQMSRIVEFYEDNEVLHRYCLSMILKDALEKEDYEIANECARIIKKLDEAQKQRSQKI